MRINEVKYDLIVIGGGATGCGVALDSSSRGLKTLLLEKNDFSSGTSSRSTKLLHGGVRYLEAAIKHFDKEQYKLVKDGLKERYLLIKNVPHLCHKVALLTPLYKWYELPYVFTGLVIYDLLSGKKSLGRSKIIWKNKAIKKFSLLKQEGLKGCVQYYDGQFNDMRMNISIAKTAEKHGAKLLNYAEVTEFIKQDGKIKGLKFYDKVDKKIYEVFSDCIINATGPFTDNIRKLDNKNSQKIMEVSSGIHIVLDKSFAPESTGLLIPETEDGRVLFILPWENSCIIGTTDEQASVEEHPKATDKEIDYLIRHINKYFNAKVSTKDIKSVWSGLRPLVVHSNTKNTASIVRDHYIEISDSNLLTITGGKWTTFRKMAEDTVDKAIDFFNLSPINKCITEKTIYYGSEKYNEEYVKNILNANKLPQDILKHLLSTYGSETDQIIKIAKEENLSERLIDNKPIIKAEVIFTIKNEFVIKPLDFLIRRTSLAETDIESAKKAIYPVAELFAKELNLNQEEMEFEIKNAGDILNNAI
jgi:glycerol-3-phosphate dehydrogenase